MTRWWSNNWLFTIPREEDKDQRVYRRFTTSGYLFFFGGRLKTLKDTNKLNLIFTLLALLIPLVLYLVFELSWLWHQVSPLVVIMFLYCWLSLVIFFVRAAGMDAGMLPKNIHLTDDANFLPAEYLNVISLPSANNFKEVEIKYCNTCRIWRLPRSSHCSICNCCVLYHDHHCLWLNNCVGQRNYPYYINFLQFTCITCVYLLVTSFVHLFSFKHSLHSIPMTLFLLIYAFLLLGYPLLLLLFQYGLIVNLLTTREYLHLAHSKTQHRQVWNSRFNTKNLWQNFALRCLRPHGVSAIGMRQRLSKDDIRLEFIKPQQDPF